MSHRFTVIFEKEDEGGYHAFCPKVLTELGVRKVVVGGAGARG